MGFTGSSADKESACNAGNPCSIPESGRSPGEGHASYPIILAWRIPMDRRAWMATVCRVTKNKTWLSDSAQHILCVLAC